MSADRISVRIRCCRESFRSIRSTPVDMYHSPLGPVPDPQGCDIHVYSEPCKQCRKFLMKYLMYHDYKEDSVLDPREPLSPKPEP